MVESRFIQNRGITSSHNKFSLTQIILSSPSCHHILFRGASPVIFTLSSLHHANSTQK